MGDSLIDTFGKYIDPLKSNKKSGNADELGTDLARRVISKTAKEEILPKKIYRLYMPIGDSSVILSDGRRYSFVNDECNVLGRHLDELLSMGARRIKQDRGQSDRIFEDENR